MSSPSHSEVLGMFRTWFIDLLIRFWCTLLTCCPSRGPVYKRLPSQALARVWPSSPRWQSQLLRSASCLRRSASACSLMSSDCVFTTYIRRALVFLSVATSTSCSYAAASSTSSVSKVAYVSNLSIIINQIMFCSGSTFKLVVLSNC